MYKLQTIALGITLSYGMNLEITSETTPQAVGIDVEIANILAQATNSDVK